MAVAGTLTYKTDIDQSGIKSGMAKTGSIIKGVIGGLGITKLISSAMSTIKNSTDDAINRLDTLNNFPKVMTNLGISADKSSKSIKKMSDKLAGLPTTLDQGASAVQRFTSKNNDVEKSTDIFLALNNAILAGGAPTEQQASALEQLSQAYAKGKPDMMEWRSAMSVMPAQLKQVATAMGYVNADELGEALRKGEVSMDEFMDTIVKLNGEGVDGLASFEEQARNSTNGIATAITVAKTQVVKGVTEIIDALNVKLESLGINGISGLIEEAGKKAKGALEVFAKLITGEISVKEFIDLALNLVKGFLKTIDKNIPKIVKEAGKIIEALIQSLTENLPEIIQIGMSIVSNITKGIAEQLPILIPQMIDLIYTITESLWDNIDLIVDAGIKLIIGLADGLVQGLPKIIDKAPVIIDKMLSAIVENLPKIIDMGIEVITKLVFGIIEALPKLQIMGPQIVIQLIGAIIQALPQLMLVGPKLIASLISGLLDSLPRLAKTGAEIVKTVINAIKDLPKKMFQWGKDAIDGFIKGIKSMLGKVGDAAKSVAKKLTGFLHFSRPDEGPLREYEKWMPDMIKGLAKSMSDNSDILAKESSNLAQTIKDNLMIDDLDDMYKEMNQAIKMENGKLSLNTVSGDVYNKTLYQTPISIDLNANVEMDSQKVGRLITPEISRTIKSGGGI